MSFGSRHLLKHSKLDDLPARRAIPQKLRASLTRAPRKQNSRGSATAIFLNDCFQSIPDPLLIADLSARIILVNTAAQVYFSSFTPDPLLGLWVPDLLRDCKRADLTGPAFLNDDLHPNMQPLVCEALDPLSRPIQLYCASLMQHALPHHTGWIFRISTRVPPQDKDLLKEEDIRFLVHDLRAPFSNIASLIELERAQKTSSAPFLVALEAQIERGLSLSAHFLQASKENLSQNPESEPAVLVDLAELLKTSMAATECRALRKQIQLQLEDLPAKPPLAQVDADLIRRAFDNLLDNAIKYSPPSSVVRCAIRSTEDEWYVEFADQGVGLNPTQTRGLFQPFTRLHQTALPATPGFGLGLAFVYRAVTASNGRIEVFDKHPGGTSFRLFFPRPMSSPAPSTRFSRDAS